MEEDKTKEPLGPQRYNPVNPTHKQSDNLYHPHNARHFTTPLNYVLPAIAKAGSIGDAKRSDLVPSLNVPGPGKYQIVSDFERAQDKPKFHMGIKTQGFTGKNLDMPGPGEYETDVIPIHHSNVAHFIGTSVRSDLGVGKAYMYPGPGEYEAQIDS